jgi:L-fuculokinase
MKKSGKMVLVFDCGATNVRVIAINTEGKIIAGKSYPNNVSPDPFFKGGLIWDVEDIWKKLCNGSLEVTFQIDKEDIAGVTVTTFGVDGAFFDREGKMLYPVISWQCKRTNPIMAGIDRYIPMNDLYRISGIYPYNFNTINKFIWYKENRPGIFDKAAAFLFFPSILIRKLSGSVVNDVTMAGTSMMTNLKSRRFSQDILDKIGITPSLFPSLEEPGKVIGTVNQAGSSQTGIPVNVPVCLAGQDTQFAIFGSGAGINEPVLSSGTWEILMTRTHQASSTDEQFNLGITTELDAAPGIYDIGINWIGSGLLEWCSNNLFSESEGNEKYETMISGAERVPPGSNGVIVSPGFYRESALGNGGAIGGLVLGSTRFEIYRAMLEALSFRLKAGIAALQKSGGFRTEMIKVVGGGSKNRLWNQIRADVCGVPVQLIDQKETTVLGAALFAFAGLGLFSSPEEARQNIHYKREIIEPSGNSVFYQSLELH